MAAVPSAIPFGASSMPPSSRSASVGSGHPSLDRNLPNGGWPAGTLTELLLANPDSGELRLLAPALKRLVHAGKKLVLLAPSYIPFAAALQELGIDRRHVVSIEAEQPADRLASVEQFLKTVNAGALLCWLPEARDDHLRRLQQTAAACDGPTFLFRPLPAQNQPSPAPLRLLCQPMPAGRMSVEIIKRRGPVHLDPLILPLSLPEIMARSLPMRTSTVAAATSTRPVASIVRPLRPLHQPRTAFLSA